MPWLSLLTRTIWSDKGVLEGAVEQGEVRQRMGRGVRVDGLVGHGLEKREA